MCYVYNKHALFFVPSSIKCVFLIDRFPPTVRAAPHQHRVQSTALCVSSSNQLSYAAYVTAGVATLRCYNTDLTTFVTHISRCVMFVDACHPSKLCPKLKRRGRWTLLNYRSCMNTEKKLLPTDASTCTCWIAKMMKLLSARFFPVTVRSAVTIFKFYSWFE